jgi:hypothetical protein
VEALDAAAAINKYSPSIVICQWMPPNTDLSAHFRANPSVREYILLGETDSGICGEMWRYVRACIVTRCFRAHPYGLALRLSMRHRTWGKKPEALIPGTATANELSPFEVEGFKRYDIPEVTRHLICKNDNFYAVGWSKAVSFRRAK